jgi:hypothetical protein
MLLGIYSEHAYASKNLIEIVSRSDSLFLLVNEPEGLFTVQEIAAYTDHNFSCSAAKK